MGKKTSKKSSTRVRVCVIPPKKREPPAPVVYATESGRAPAGPSLSTARYVGLAEHSKALLLLDCIERLHKPRLTSKGWRLEGNRMTSTTVMEIADLVLHLWPIGFVAPPPVESPGAMRAAYWGRQTPGAFARTVTRTSLYCDQIYCGNPLVSRMLYCPENSPKIVPEKWTLHFEQSAIYLAAIKPWVEAGIVELTTHPSQTCPEIAEKFERLGELSFNRIKASLNDDLAGEMFAEMFLGWPDSDVRQILALLPNEDLPKFRDALARLRAEEPHLQHLDPPAGSQIAVTGNGTNYAAIHDFAASSNAAILTDSSLHGRMLRMHSAPTTQLGAINEAMQKLPLRFLNDVPADFAIRIRKEGRIQRFRRLLQDTAMLARSAHGLECSDEIVARLKEQYEDYRNEWKEIQCNLAVEGLIPSASAAISVLTGTLAFAGGGLAALPIVAAPAWKLYRSVHARQSLSRQPIGLLFELDRSA